MKKAIILLLAGIFFAACNCNYYLNKARSKCGYTEKVDTVKVVVHDTIQGFRKDTLFKFVGDTVYIKKDSVTVKYFYNTKTNDNYISVNKPPVVVTNTVAVPVKTIVIHPDYSAYLKWAALLALAIACILFLVRKR